MGEHHDVPDFIVPVKEKEERMWLAETKGEMRTNSAS
jgi:hypothetical protein